MSERKEEEEVDNLKGRVVYLNDKDEITKKVYEDLHSLDIFFFFFKPEGK